MTYKPYEPPAANRAELNAERDPLILYVEDEENDVFLLERAIRRVGLPARLKVCQTGFEAIDFFDTDRRQEVILLLLDINLPRMSGLEILQWVRRESALRELPAIVFTSSEEECDRLKEQESGPTAYVMKPANLEAYQEFARSLEAYLQPIGEHDRRSHTTQR